ncbi:MAG: hypothetical protein KBC42_02725 [Candidatus Pacebacteria bacterium]|nr:hypothetical protein [Candidatus Paceibacterota bacterium]MBP9780815.1 hypothetical protein [Candidatus Paceibacterota bacterium]
MEQNSTVGTRVEKNNLIVGALILLIGIVIGGVFGGGMMSNVDDTNLQGQAIESQQQYVDSTNDRNIPTDEQVAAMKNIKMTRFVTGTKQELMTAFGIDVDKYVSSKPDENIKKIVDDVASLQGTNTGQSNNPDLVNFSCFQFGFGPFAFYEGGFSVYAYNWWSNPSTNPNGISGITDCYISSIW